MRTRALAAVLIVGAAVPAVAADVMVDDVVVAESAYDWPGPYVGAGVDAAIIDNIFLRAEYRSTDFEDVTPAPQNGLVGTCEDTSPIQALRPGAA